MSASPSGDSPPVDLTNRVIVITGAGRGIGRACAVHAARAGATVVLLGRRVANLEATYDAIEQAGGPQPAIFPLDLESAALEHFEELSEAIDNAFGRLDGIIHCAIAFQGLTPLVNLDFESWYKNLQVNLNAPFILTQMLLPTLKESDSAAIVFSHDPVADRGEAYWGAYAVAKGGQLALMKLFAEELEANTQITTYAVDPGEVNSDLRFRVQPVRDPNWRTPESVAPLYLRGFGKNARALNGQIVTQ